MSEPMLSPPAVAPPLPWWQRAWSWVLENPGKTALGVAGALAVACSVYPEIPEPVCRAAQLLPRLVEMLTGSPPTGHAP